MINLSSCIDGRADCSRRPSYRLGHVLTKRRIERGELERDGLEYEADIAAISIISRTEE